MDVEHCVIAVTSELARFLSAADKTPLQRLSYMSCRPPLTLAGFRAFDGAKLQLFSKLDKKVCLCLYWGQRQSRYFHYSPRWIQGVRTRHYPSQRDDYCIFVILFCFHLPTVATRALYLVYPRLPHPTRPLEQCYNNHALAHGAFSPWVTKVTLGGLL